ncbi:protein asteroid homolog 1 [Gouania willdenowi]|uniref:protein asteroid homolog 1 n=1 Tax=Gouania willdenowi TaxID=441366 RepID=UPI001054C26C|nr:protein asteroid homolog 1 [Gouania willdenowi]
MGVHGLTTFVENHRNLLQNVKFRDSRLVIDGCGLYYRLYFTSGLDQQRGGDYDAFAALLHQFISALEACRIQPYVVLDGGMDPSEKKFGTLKQRIQSKIREADTLAHGRSGSVLPILVRHVFIQVLTQRGVPLVQCPAEADWDIACLAHQWKCPVLTSDSDFYIFDLPGGYLPFQNFQWANLNGNPSQRYISARRYTAHSLCQWFGSNNCEMLALGAVLLGNDYGTPKAVEKIFAVIDSQHVPRGSGGRGRSGTSSTRIDVLFLWLFSMSNVTEALEEISQIMAGQGRAQKDKIISQLRAGMQDYFIKPQSSLARWFSEGGKGSLLGQTPSLPEYLSCTAARGLLPPLVVDALLMHRAFLTPQVENSKLASSHCASKLIRQAVYGILLQETNGNTTQEYEDIQPFPNAPQGGVQQRRRRGGRGRGGRGRGDVLPDPHGVTVGFGRGEVASAAAVPDHSSRSIFVEEYDRLDLNLKVNQVEALPPTNIHPERLAQTPVAKRLGVLLNVLEVMEPTLAPVPPNLQLVVAVTNFWLRKTTPTPSELHLQAMVLGLVYGELSWSTQPGLTHVSYGVTQINWAAECKVQAKLDRHRVRPGGRRGLDIGLAHSFSQWQSCLWITLCLNELLLQPLPAPHLSYIFSGTLVHGLFRSLKGGQAAESLLASGSLSSQLYSSLLNAAKNGRRPNPSSASQRRSRGQGGRGRQRGGRRVAGGARGVNELSNRFAFLNTDDVLD